MRRGRWDMKRERERKKKNNGRAAIYNFFLKNFQKEKKEAECLEGRIKTEKEKQSVCQIFNNKQNGLQQKASKVKF